MHLSSVTRANYCAILGCHFILECRGHSPWSFIMTSFLHHVWPLGQIELYTHIPAMRELVDKLKLWNFSLCSVFLLDSQFLTDAAKFVSGVMIALSTMITLELPHINIISKMDLLDKRTKETIEKFVVIPCHHWHDHTQFLTPPTLLLCFVSSHPC